MAMDHPDPKDWEGCMAFLEREDVSRALQYAVLHCAMYQWFAAGHHELSDQRVIAWIIRWEEHVRAMTKFLCARNIPRNIEVEHLYRELENHGYL